MSTLTGGQGSESRPHTPTCSGPQGHVSSRCGQVTTTTGYCSFTETRRHSSMRRRFHTPGLGTHTQKVLTTGMFESRKARVPGSLAPEMSSRKAKARSKIWRLGCGPTGFLRRGMHCLRVRKMLAPYPPAEWSRTSVCVSTL